MDMNNTCCIDTPNCSCNTGNHCCHGVRVAGCGNPIYNVFTWNRHCHHCCQPEQCAIDMLYEYLPKEEAAELYINNRDLYNLQDAIADTYETKQHAYEVEQNLWNAINTIEHPEATNAVSVLDRLTSQIGVINAALLSLDTSYGSSLKIEETTLYLKDKLGNTLSAVQIPVPVIPTIQVDQTLSSVSVNPVQNKAITDAFNTMDETLNSVSAASVQNRQDIQALQAAIDDIPSIEPDSFVKREDVQSTIAAGSDKLVTSGAIYMAVNQATSSVEQLQSTVANIGSTMSAISSATSAHDGSITRLLDVVGGGYENVNQYWNRMQDPSTAAQYPAILTKLDTLYSAVGGKQPMLIQGVNLKTVNGQSILMNSASDPTDITVSAQITVDDHLDANSTNPVQNRVINGSISNLGTTLTQLNTSLADLQTGVVAMQNDIDTIDRRVSVEVIDSFVQKADTTNEVQSGSTKLVTSGGVDSALQSVANRVASSTALGNIKVGFTTPSSASYLLPVELDNSNKAYVSALSLSNSLYSLDKRVEDLENATPVSITVDSTLSTNSTNPVQNKVINSAISGIQTTLAGKQNALVSGTNIKTINGSSLLGSGDITISSGGTISVDSQLDGQSTNPVQNSTISSAIADINTDIAGIESSLTTLENTVDSIDRRTPESRFENLISRSEVQSEVQSGSNNLVTSSGINSAIQSINVSIQDGTYGSGAETWKNLSVSTGNHSPFLRVRDQIKDSYGVQDTMPTVPTIAAVQTLLSEIVTILSSFSAATSASQHTNRFIISTSGDIRGMYYSDGTNWYRCADGTMLSTSE